MAVEKITIDIETSLDVATKLDTLISGMTGENSLYIKAKETLDYLFQNNNMSQVDKANIITNLLTNITIQGTQVAMNTALEWTKAEKEFALRKFESEYQVTKLSYETMTAQTLANKANVDFQYADAQLLNEYGTIVLTNGRVSGISETGTEAKYKLAMIKSQSENEAEKKTQIQAQTKELYARTHQIVADTVVNHGAYTWSNLAATGLADVTKVTTGIETLSSVQINVGKEQAKGYAYNAWANATSSSASMIGTLLTTESSVDYSGYLTAWKTTLDKLSGITVPSALISQ